MSNKKLGLIGAIVNMKCPACRQGNMFNTKSVFPLSSLQKMPEKCDVCGQKMELEPGFYYGTGYVSYGLSVALLVFNAVWYHVLFGLSFLNNSIFYYLIISISMLILLLPWIVRYSRVIYLNIFVKYKYGKRRVDED